MSEPILATKLSFPPPRRNLVLRPRLSERLAAGLQEPLTLISAPPGSGKTTLMSDRLYTTVSGSAILGRGVLVVAIAALASLLPAWQAARKEPSEALQNGIRLETGHVQIRATSYQREKLSLLAKDLLADSDALAARASAMAEVHAAAPVLWAGGILNTAGDSAGVQIYGIATASSVFAPIRDALAGGEWLAADGRAGRRSASSSSFSLQSRCSAPTRTSSCRCF
jgi:ABC-type lipoprotein release transport system permease subunit